MKPQFSVVRVPDPKAPGRHAYQVARLVEVRDWSPRGSVQVAILLEPDQTWATKAQAAAIAQLAALRVGGVVRGGTRETVPGAFPMATLLVA